jgi:condensin complex subunit 1
MGATMQESIHVLLQRLNDDPGSLASTTSSESAAAFSAGELDARLNEMIDRVGEDCTCIVDLHVFETFAWYLLQFEELNGHLRMKLFDAITSGLQSITTEVASTVDSTVESSKLEVFRAPMEYHAFLLMWAVSAFEIHCSANTTAAKPAKQQGRSKAGGGRKSIAPSSDASGKLDPSNQLQAALNVVAKILSFKLLKIWPTSSERDSFISVLTRMMYLLSENEAHMKNIALKMRIFKCLCLAIKHHGHAVNAQTSVLQNLQYYEHLSEPMAEFLKILAEQYDYPQLAEEVLR